MRETLFLTLLGIKHVGKSSVARQLHKLLGERSHTSEVYDTDQHIIFRYQKEAPEKNTTSIRDIYREAGKEHFLQLEADILLELSQPPLMPSQRITIIATGGGVADNNAACLALEGLRPLLYLWGDPELLYERIARRGIPPFLTSSDPQREFFELARRRDEVYRLIADHMIDTTEKTPQEVAHNILSEMRY
jgi:shikimate kinase